MNTYTIVQQFLRLNNITCDTRIRYNNSVNVDVNSYYSVYAYHKLCYLNEGIVATNLLPLIISVMINNYIIQVSVKYHYSYNNDTCTLYLRIAPTAAIIITNNANKTIKRNATCVG